MSLGFLKNLATKNLIASKSSVFGLRTQSITYNKSSLRRKSESIGHVITDGYSVTENDEKDFNRDFRYRLVQSDIDSVTDPRFRLDSIRKQPVVLLFGWAGATSRNLDKYASIYHRAGCSTLSYILPSRFIFLKTAQIPHLAEKLLRELKGHHLLERPIFIHDFSDTGLMVHQGIYDLIQRGKWPSLNVQGYIFDSCPGPRPKATLHQTLALLVVNWICCGRDGNNLTEKIHSTKEFLQKRIVPDLMSRLKGQDAFLSLINGIWSGHFARDELGRDSCPELFLYSCTDYYLPWKYLEDEILEPRKRSGKRLFIRKWNRSPHVGHLKVHKTEYETSVLDFLYQTYFIKMNCP